MDKGHLLGLNPMQTEAATHTEGPLLIVAGAGAGKTKTVTHRIVHLVTQGVHPSKILAVTFTNKAAKEMRERIFAALGQLGILGRSDGDEQRKFSTGNFRADQLAQGSVFVSTFHSLGVFIIKENAGLLGLTKHFSILDEGDTVSLIKDILKDMGLDIKQYEPKKIRGAISREKGKSVSQREYSERVLGFGGGAEAVIARVWEKYEHRKEKENSLDFDDLLVKTIELFTKHKDLLHKYQQRWHYIHIDEYQDTNEVQYRIVKMLAEKNKNICVVGDMDQLVYSWRGANMKNIMGFEKDYEGTKVVLLEENYRSTQNILAAANEVIKKNNYRVEKNLFTKNEEGEKLSLYEALDESDEAEFVAVKILELVDEGKIRGFSSGLVEGTQEKNTSVPDPRTREKFANLSEVAILYRANFQSRALEEAMLRYNIPYQVLGVKFFERKEIKDTLSYIRASLNPESLSDIKRIINFPARGIGKASLAKIFAGEKSSLPIKMQIKLQNFYDILAEIKEVISREPASVVIKYVIEKTGIKDELLTGGEEELERLENIKELATLAIKYDNLENGLGIEKLLEDTALASDQDSLIINKENKKEVNAVKLMTVHASKGLEFKYVFIVGLEDGLFPSSPRVSDSISKSAEDAEEERRLFYVALTRAREKVYLSFANYRTIFGSRQINAPSEFLGDIPPDLIHRERGNILKTIYL